MNNNHNSDFNPFRENGSNTDSPHVTFAAKSPSIIPTPIYDDSSSILSSPYTMSSFASNNQPQFTSSPLPITRQVDLPEPSTPMPTVAEENDKDAFDSKVEVASNSNYGPTFREEDVTAQHVLSEGALLTRGFVPPKDDHEEIQLNDYNSSPSHSNNFIPPPEQSRVDIFMSKLKGYERPTDMREVEEGGYKNNQSRDILRRDMPKQRGLLFRQLFGDAVYPIFTWISAIVMVAVFAYELFRNHQLSGSVIQTSPFNPMIGPNYLALVTMGSKFDPCIRSVAKYPPTASIGNCYTQTSTCTIETACGFGGFNGSEPNQSFRFFLPIFLHAGVVHILLNLINYFQSGPHIERTLGSIRFIILFLGSGIWGFILSATLSGSLSSSMGCSGALFGLLGYELVELVIRWRDVRNPCSQFVKLNIIIIISLAIGLLPGLDNFAHIGGFIMGLLLSALLSPEHPSRSRRALILIWVARVISLILVIVLYVVFLNIFNTATDLDAVCPNCKYLSCLPVNGWCDV